MSFITKAHRPSKHQNVGAKSLAAVSCIHTSYPKEYDVTGCPCELPPLVHLRSRSLFPQCSLATSCNFGLHQCALCTHAGPTSLLLSLAGKLDCFSSVPLLFGPLRRICPSYSSANLSSPLSLSCSASLVMAVSIIYRTRLPMVAALMLQPQPPVDFLQQT